MTNAITNEEIRRPQPPPLTEPKPRPEDPREDQSQPYRDFLKKKRPGSEAAGIIVAPDDLPAALFPFQRELVSWALERGRAALLRANGHPERGADELAAFARIRFGREDGLPLFIRASE